MVVTFDFDDTLLWTRVIRDEDGEYIDHVPVGQNRRSSRFSGVPCKLRVWKSMSSHRGARRPNLSSRSLIACVTGEFSSNPSSWVSDSRTAI